MSHTPPTHIEVEGDKPKVERTRQHFSALRAGLKTAEELSHDLERENAELRERLERADDLIEDCWNQFAYTNEKGERLAGGLSTLEAIQAWRAGGAT